ncbi:MAG: 4Fe-4S binding protein, partial [Betaproteobacteria bacterium]
MLSRAREKGLVVVRGLLAAGWIALIASLFWDPVTPQLTRPESVSSPFHLQDKAVVVQGRPLPQEPYAMGNRIFWTMLIPLLPLFFMVAGHEAWRRICPLSFFSQLPRYLRLQRKRPVLDRRSGKVSRQIALVSRDGWARRNAWYIQFGLLFAGLNARLLFVNSDRTALALFLLFVIACAMVVGALYGGKTWCNYVCPVAVVQKIYTQPRGLLESAAHLERRPVSQSMCRAPGKDGDRSICVGCTPSCPDIDLERSHWDTVDDPVRRNVHYMFFGLMLGFYYFYYFYSGNWAYYFSGAWTHERDALAALAGPGLYIGGHAIGLPKYAAAPLVTALFAAAAGLAGRAVESIYVRVRRRWGGPLPESVLRSHTLVFSAYITINTFYLFGGRPNLNLLPAPALQVVDFMIVALSTLWFWQALQRSPMRYRREGLASSLLGQLRALRLDISRFIEDRRLEDLAPDEVYVLAKTLPQFSREQKLTAYRNILEDALRRGRTNSAASLEVLREVRSELGVSDEEHRRLVGELGDGAEAALDPGQAASYENFLRVDNYRQVLELALIGHLEKGQRLAAILDRPEVRSTIARGREFYRITAAEHESALAQVTGGEGMIFDRARSLVGPLRKLASLRLGLAALAPGDSDEVALRRLLARALRKRIVTLCTREFSALLALGDSAEARWLAGNLASFLGTDLEAALAERVEPSGEVTWEQSLPPLTLMVLRGEHAEAGREPLHRHAPVSYHEVLDECLDLAGNLAALASDEDPHLQALALAALSCIDAARARDTAVALAARERHPHWFLREVLAGLLRPDGARPDEMRRPNSLSVTLASPSAPARTFLFEKPQVTVGK